MPQLHELSNRLVFPKSMCIGAATSPFQHEGNRDETRHTDWDVIPETGAGISTGNYNPDWWTEGKAETDIGTLHELGLALRIGVEWARIMPDRGRIDSTAVKRYKKLSEFSEQLGMQLCITLNHFTLPDWIAQNGGWENRENLQYFKDFSKYASDMFGNARYFVTLNEPSHLGSMGYLSGEWPPYKKWDVLANKRVTENLVEANRIAYEEIKKVSSKSLVGAAHPVAWLQPANPKSPLDKTMAKIGNYITNFSIIDSMRDHADFIGINFYHGYQVKFNPTKLRVTMRDDIHGATKTAPFLETVVPESYASDAGWPVVPDFFFNALMQIYKRYGKPIVITENGVDDEHDQIREYYMYHHLRAIHEAQKNGVDIRGYFYWAATDSWEWMQQKAYHFGLIALDKNGSKRVRESSRLLGAVASTHTLALDRQETYDRYPERTIFKASHRQ